MVNVDAEQPEANAPTSLTSQSVLSKSTNTAQPTGSFARAATIGQSSNTATSLGSSTEQQLPHMTSNAAALTSQRLLVNSANAPSTASPTRPFIFGQGGNAATSSGTGNRHQPPNMASDAAALTSQQPSPNRGNAAQSTASLARPFIFGQSSNATASSGSSNQQPPQFNFPTSSSSSFTYSTIGVSMAPPYQVRNRNSFPSSSPQRHPHQRQVRGGGGAGAGGGGSKQGGKKRAALTMGLGRDEIDNGEKTRKRRRREEEGEIAPLVVRLSNSLHSSVMAPDILCLDVLCLMFSSCLGADL